MLDLGTVRPGSTIRIPFSTFDKDDGSSITMTNFAAADILIYKDGSTTERASTSGFTATTDFDTKTGKHLITIDLADNTTANFYAAGSEYLVAVDSVTVDAVTVGSWVARFRIGYPGAILDTTIATLSSQTSFTLTTGPAEDDALNGHWVIIHDIASAVQMGKALILDYTGSTKTVTLVAGTTFTAAAGDNISVMDLAPLQPTTTGRTLDVTATGAAGIDWANVENQSTSVSLSATTVATVTTTTTATNVTTVNGLAANVITAAATAADFGTEVGTAVWATTTRTLSAATNITSTGASVPITAGGLVSADVTAISTDTTAANNAESFFDGTGYAGTNNVIPLVTTTTTATNVTTVNGLAANVITAASMAADASAEIADAVWDELQSGHVAAGSFGEIATEIADILVDTSTTLQGELDGIQADTEDIQSRLPAALISGRIDASVGAMAAGVVTAAAIATGAIDADALATDAVAEIADGVWDEALSGHLTAGSTGNALNAAGSAGDPWSTTLPGAYGAGSAGYIVGTNLNATVSSRSSHSAADVWAVATRVLTAATNITSTGGSVPITAGGLVSSDVTAISTDTTAANNCEAFFDGTGYAGTNNVIPTVTNVTTVNGLAAGVITTASIADNAITTGKIDVTAYDTMASTVWEDSVALHTTPGTFGGNFATITSIDGKVDTIDTVVDAIKVKTDYLPSATAGAAGGVFIAGSNAATTVNITGNLTGNVTGTIGGLSAGALADLFDTDSGTTYASAVAGSVVKEIADNAGGSGLTAGAIADAVWDEAISGHLTSGSTGAKLNSAASAGDPWSTSLPGTYTGTEAGAILGTLRSSTMTVSHPVPSEDNTIELVIGDDYYAADSRNLSFSYGATPSLSGATVKFKIQLEENDTGYSSTNTSTTTTGSVSGTNPQVVTFDIPGTTTDDLSEGWHDYEVEATLSNGHVVTLTRGRVEMLSQVV